MRRETKRQIEALARAGIAERGEFQTKRDGELNARGRAKLERYWTEFAGTVSDPAARPFHTYRPRSREKLAEAAKFLGIDLRRFPKLRAIPVPVPAGEKVRVRFDRHGSMAITYAGRRPPVKLVKLYAPNERARAIRHESRLARKGKQASVTIRTGKGSWSPLDGKRRKRVKGHGRKRPEFGTIAEGLAYLSEAYEDSDAWIKGIEIVEES